MKKLAVTFAALASSALLLAGCASPADPTPQPVPTPPSPGANHGVSLLPVNDDELKLELIEKHLSEDPLEVLDKVNYWTQLTSETAVVFLGGSGTADCYYRLGEFKLEDGLAVLTGAEFWGDQACTMDYTIRPYILTMKGTESIDSIEAIRICDETGESCYDLTRFDAAKS